MIGNNDEFDEWKSHVWHQCLLFSFAAIYAAHVFALIFTIAMVTAENGLWIEM